MVETPVVVAGRVARVDNRALLRLLCGRRTRIMLILHGIILVVVIVQKGGGGRIQGIVVIGGGATRGGIGRKVVGRRGQEGTDFADQGLFVFTVLLLLVLFLFLGGRVSTSSVSTAATTVVSL